MNSFARRLVVVVLIASALPVVADDDWPLFRGAKRTGVSDDKGLLKEWPKDGPPLAWKCDGVGAGFSSVSISGDRVFTMGDLEDGSYLFAIDRGTGAMAWKLKVGKTGGNYKGPRCTPAVSDGLVYGLGQFGDLVCADVKDGSEVWRKSLKTDFKGQEGGWNYTESPLIDGEKLLVTPGGKEASMLALNKKNGDVIWKGVAPGGESAGYSSIVAADILGTRQYIQLMSQGLVSFSADKGELLWRYGTERERFARNTANIPTPIVVGNQVFASAGYGRGGALLTLSKSDSTFSVKEEYWKNELNNKHGGIILVGDRLFGDVDSNGQPWCASLKDGKNQWKMERGKGTGSASVTYADGLLYIRFSNGYLSLVNPDDGKEISYFKVPNGTRDCWAHPVVVGGKLYVREQNTLWCYDVKAK